MTRDFDSYNMLTLGLNVNLGSKSTQPLWWENPLDYVYSEMTKPNHTMRPTPPCADTDMDGVCDNIDKEVTASGCPVDVMGVSRDTDGDGVPDCKDKELITPTACQKELDADGIGKCPAPECCTKTTVDPPVKVEGCEAVQAVAMTFEERSCALSTEAKAQLDELASQMKTGADCNIAITAGTTVEKGDQKAADCRLAAITSYLVNKKGIAKSRISTSKSEDGDASSVNIELAK